MDNSDPHIRFDELGICNHCHRIKKLFSYTLKERDLHSLNSILTKIKKNGIDSEYDCILGLSGGVDSSYLALKVKEWGLRPLVFHVDAGWNSEVAVSNIEKVVKYCNFDLQTYVVDWRAMRDLHLAYLRSGVSNQDVPQDHIFFSAQYHFAVKNQIKYILSGGNLASESVSPDVWNHSAMDALNIYDIYNKHGSGKLKNYETISFFQYYFYYPFIKRLKTFRLLDLIQYDYIKAQKELESLIGWTNYGRKHGESVFTKIFQNYILPKRFGFDKRKIHYSSLILSGQMTRTEALNKLNDPLYDEIELEKDIEYFCKKLQISKDDFIHFINLPLSDYSKYANWDSRLRVLKAIQKFFQCVLGRNISFY
jgi:N-acetyl sugar amidotransferase